MAYFNIDRNGPDKIGKVDNTDCFILPSQLVIIVELEGKEKTKFKIPTEIILVPFSKQKHVATFVFLKRTI